MTSKLPVFNANGSNLTLNDTGKVNGAGNRLFVAEIHFPDGSKSYLKHYQSGNGPVRNATEEVEVFDSAKGKVTRAKGKAAPAADSRMDKLEAMLAALLAKTA